MRAPLRRLGPRARDGLGRGRREGRALLARHGADLLTFVCLLGVSALLYAEFTDVYRVVAVTGPVLETRGAGDQHSHALIVIGIGIGAAVVLARLTGSPLPAVAAGALGAVALGITLIGDLPDVTSSGLVSGGEPAEAEPAAGFWLELGGALLTLGGALALARLLALARRPAYQR